jgi:hypothetical protein
MANGWTGFIGSITHFFRIAGVWVRACERHEYVDTGDRDNGDILICASFESLQCRVNGI